MDSTAPLGKERSKVRFQTYWVGAWRLESKDCSMRSPKVLMPSRLLADSGNTKLPGTLPPAVPMSERTSCPNPVNRGPNGLLTLVISKVLAWLVKLEVNPRVLFKSQST